jgi:alkylation response protein AidB-like acyl-CoA dehydrogenase
MPMGPLGLDDGTAEIRELTRGFVEREVAPRVIQYNREGSLPQDLVRKVTELGLVGGVVPSEYGGSDMDYLTWAACVEEIARYCTSLAAVVGYPSSLAGRGLLGWGTEEQKEKFLTPLASGQCLAATAITEPDSGSDAAAMRTSARRVDGGFALNGQKTWISNANTAQWLLVFATVDRERGRDGITAFLVDRETPGVETRPLHNKLSNRISDTGEVFFADAIVTEDRVLGDVGDGWRILTASVEAGRLHVATRSVGIAQGCLDMSIAYAKSRHAFGREIGRLQLVQRMITEMSLGVETARMVVRQAAHALQAGSSDTGYWVSLAKLHASRVAMSAAHDAIQIHGAYGISDEYHVDRLFREAKMQEIVDGTTEIQQLLVANALLRD